MPGVLRVVAALVCSVALVGSGAVVAHGAPASATTRSGALGPSTPATPAGWTLASPSATAANPAATKYTVNLGYADSSGAAPSHFPTPWNGAPGVEFEGCTANCTFDAGAVQVVNTSTTSLRVVSVQITYDTCVYDIWPHGVVIARGASMIVTQTASGTAGGCTPDTGQMNGSDIGPGGSNWSGNCTQSDVIPQIAVRVGAVTTTFADTGQVLNTGGVDQGSCGPYVGNESTPWTPAGATPCRDSAIKLTPTSAIQNAGTTLIEKVGFRNSCGNPLAGVSVRFTVTAGPDAGSSATRTTNAAGIATYAMANGGIQGIDHVRVTTANPAGTITSNRATDYFEQARLNLNPATGAPGNAISYSGTGYAANETVELHGNAVDGALLTTDTANASGAISGTFVVPIPTGDPLSEVVAAGQSSDNQGWALFTSACSNDWAAGVSGDFNAAGNWSAGHVPTPSEVACIVAPGSYTVTMNSSNTIAGLLLGAPNATTTQTLYLNGRGAVLTLNGASTISAQGDLALGSADNVYSMINGSGTLTNDGTLRTVNQNGAQRYLRLAIVNDPSGTVSIGNFDTRVDAGTTFTNHGTLAVLAGGSLSVTGSSTLSLADGSVTVGGNGSLTLSGATLAATGGTVSGAVTMTSTAFTDTGTSGGLYNLYCADTLAGTVAANQTLNIRGGQGCGATATLSGTVHNLGKLTLGSDDGSPVVLTGGTLDNTATLNIAQENGGSRLLHSDVVNEVTGTTTVTAFDTRMDAGDTLTQAGSLTLSGSGTLGFYGNSTYQQTGGTLTNAVGYAHFYVQDSTYTATGGALSGMALFNNATVIDNGGTGGTLITHCANTFGGTVPADQTLVVRGDECGASTTTLSGSVVNNGALTLTSTNGNSATLQGGSLTNNATFQAVQSVGGSRYVRTSVTNSATGTTTFGSYDTRVDQAGTTFINQGALKVATGSNGTFVANTLVAASGTITVTATATLVVSGGGTVSTTGGTLSGTIVVSNSTLDGAGGDGGTFTLQCASTLSGTIQATQTVDAQGNGCGPAVVTIDAAGATNLGTLAMDSTSASDTVLQGGALTNRGTLLLQPGAGGIRYLRAKVVNGANGVILMTAIDTRMDASTALSNTKNGRLTIRDGSVLTLSAGASFTQASTATLGVAVNAATGASGISGTGALTLDGTLKVTTVGTPVPGTPYVALVGTSVTGTFAVTPLNYIVSYSSTRVILTKR